MFCFFLSAGQKSKKTVGNLANSKVICFTFYKISNLVVVDFRGRTEKKFLRMILGYTWAILAFFT